ncbi:MAG TPA: hypothetical protein DCW90_06345 [Lachnospiraceae bacterium]|nr:DNA polymerase III subunit alpha [uncultured Lachnoclostridium sp.]HAU85118.1 hypothetical protein [Lachnospiraceae bacterium]
MNNIYTITHCHTDFSNGTTNIDSVSKYQQYVDRAVELGMKAIAITEHGNIFGWVKKKEYIESKGLKYIHGVEMYLTKSLDKKVRDNYHICLYAKNYHGILELNKLISGAYNRKDGHFYYAPRITFDELLATSDNILFTTACIGGVLAGKDEELKRRFLDFICKNKHRAWLEVQHHQDQVQIDYNRYLLGLSRELGLNLICGTDTHALNERHAKGRKILQKSKGVKFSDEDGWDVTLKTYEELVELFTKQGIFSLEEIHQLLDNTNILSNNIEEFSLDRSHKYPKLFNDSLSVLKKKIMKGIKEKGVDKYPNFQEYIDRIKYELSVYEHNKAIDYLLLDEDIKAFGREQGIFCGPSRGSVSGSVIAYLIGMTEMDSIKHKLNFERFMNAERISLADVDTDWPPAKRDVVKDYIFNKEGLYCAEIITFNTVALKGSIRDCARALDIPLDVVGTICSDIDDPNKEAMYRRQYPELFEYVDIVNGTIVSTGTHPCGSIVSPIPLDTEIGTLTLSTTDRPVSMLYKNEVEGLNFVKLDILGLDNVELINETCRLAGIERLTPDNVPDDLEVWSSIRDNTVGIFQWESDMASKYLASLFSDETINKIRKANPDFKYIDLFSVGNGAIRPAGASYRDQLANGIFQDNGHRALNDFLAPTLGYLVYQEQIIDFLHIFCGFTMGEADTVRRAFAKKTGTEVYIPRIKAGFAKTMLEQHGVCEEESERLIVNFIQVIIDASNYLFSLNHSQAYSYIGYICGYLRYYYPLEFFTAMLNINSGNMDKTSKTIELAKLSGISIEPPTYGKSRAAYFFDKSNNIIYKGIESVKYLNEDLAESLYELSSYQNYASFEDLYLNTPGINSRQWEVLIKIGYFRAFGPAKRLLGIVEICNAYATKKQYKKDSVDCDLIRRFAGSETEKMFRDVDNAALCKYLISGIGNDEFTIGELAKFEAEYIGSINITNPATNNRECIVLDIDTKYTPVLTLYRIQNGDIIKVKVAKDFYYNKKIRKFSHIYVSHAEKRNKKKRVDGKWITMKDFDIYVNYFIISL